MGTPSRGARWCPGGAAPAAVAPPVPLGEPLRGRVAAQRQARAETDVVLPVERAQLETNLRGGVLVLTARGVQLCCVGRGDREEPGEFELRVARDQLVFAFDDRVLGATV